MCTQHKLFGPMCSSRVVLVQQQDIPGRVPGQCWCNTIAVECSGYECQVSVVQQQNVLGIMPGQCWCSSRTSWVQCQVSVGLAVGLSWLQCQVSVGVVVGFLEYSLCWCSSGMSLVQYQVGVGVAVRTQNDQGTVPARFVLEYNALGTVHVYPHHASKVCIQNGKKLYDAFIEFRKYFDSINKQRSGYKLTKAGINN